MFLLNSYCMTKTFFKPQVIFWMYLGWSSSFISRTQWSMFEDSDTAKLIRILISIIYSYGYYILDSSCGPNFLQQMNMKSAKKSRKVDVEKMWRGLACCSPWGHKVRLSDLTKLNWTGWICYNIASVLCFGFLAARHMWSYFPDLGSNPHPLHWRVTS